ncbi:hypothetical protein [Acidianus bottle-shaped virus 3 strain ABV3]|uniref:Uncharacterized protein n=1 Tax=Acidianus bottle-shaped virus 3 strain ABV3 TaxID=1732174 RepID=A0A0N9NIA5_9VIRU|nr:hypothetical protein AVU00_gp62 [Acidianus bottle-shaped virus 3 strain ABV3]ALG96864.1 hypothetical protein [Acidianus bottle-shaped virus 3 strain ABV3]
MGCQTYNLSYGAVPLCKCTKGIQPLCKPVVPYTPPTLQCPSETIEFTPNPFCDLLPPDVFDSLPDFLINLPIVLLFIVSMPARFLYCFAYNLLFYFDELVQIFLTYFYLPLLDFATAPFLYFTVGFTYGINNVIPPPLPGLWGYVQNACVTGIFATIYRIWGGLWYYLGYANGFLSGLLIDLVDFILYGLCYIAYLTINLGFCIAINFVLGSFSGGIEVSIQPFSLLQYFLCNIVNCGCVLGSPPQVDAVFCISIFEPCPSCCNCGFGYQPPQCPAIPGEQLPQVSIPVISAILSEIYELSGCIPLQGQSDQCYCLKVYSENYYCQPIHSDNTCLCIPVFETSESSESSESSETSDSNDPSTLPKYYDSS